MSISVSALRREYEIRKWVGVLQTFPYIAVIQITGGRCWGRTNMKSRILEKSTDVNTRFAVPKCAREAALRTRFTGLSELFRGAPSAVVWGDDVDKVVEVVKRAVGVIDGGVVVGGRFGERIATARVWQTVLDSGGEKEEWGKLVGVLGKTPGVVQVLQRQQRGVLDAVEGGGKLVRVLDRIHPLESDGS